MEPRVFIDTTIFIYSFEYPSSNSAKIIDLLNKEELEAITSDRVLKEVTKYFEKFHSITLARIFRKYILGACLLIYKDNALDKIADLKGKIKDKDIEQVAITKKYGIKYLIAFDRDFKSFEEYITPKKFLQIFGKEASITEF